MPDELFFVDSFFDTLSSFNLTNFSPLNFPVSELSLDSGAIGKRIPEPATLGLLLIAACLAGALQRKNR